jgi:Carbohydrate esterase, sialic acid-specific acetylesterase
MAGRGEPLLLAAPSDPRLLIWREGGWQVAADPLQVSTKAKERRPGIGPGMIGLQLLKWQSGVQVGLIMCANGGSSIRDWLQDRPLYRQCVDQIHASGGRIDGVLFL